MTRRASKIGFLAFFVVCLVYILKKLINCGISRKTPKPKGSRSFPFRTRTLARRWRGAVPLSFVLLSSVHPLYASNSRPFVLLCFDPCCPQDLLWVLVILYVHDLLKWLPDIGTDMTLTLGRMPPKENQLIGSINVFLPHKDGCFAYCSSTSDKKPRSSSPRAAAHAAPGAAARKCLRGASRDTRMNGFSELRRTSCCLLPLTSVTKETQTIALQPPLFLHHIFRCDPETSDSISYHFRSSSYHFCVITNHVCGGKYILFHHNNQTVYDLPHSILARLPP